LDPDIGEITLWPCTYVRVSNRNVSVLTEQSITEVHNILSCNGIYRRDGPV
jgi:hypothetical protein